jgi:hypothetical protein
MIVGATRHDLVPLLDETFTHRLCVLNDLLCVSAKLVCQYFSERDRL